MPPRTDDPLFRLLRPKVDDKLVDIPAQKTKRRQVRRAVHNACKVCRSQKAKCSGTAPCLRCATNGHECVFPGRAHERVSQDLFEAQKSLLASQQEVATLQQDLAATLQDLTTSRQDLTTAQQALAATQEALLGAQQDLKTARLRVIEVQNLAQDQKRSVENIFDILCMAHHFNDVNLKETAMASMDAASFAKKMSTIPRDVAREIYLARYLGEIPPKGFDEVTFAAISSIAPFSPHSEVISS